ncbi:MAG: hypothetical protein ACI4VX_04045 [Succinivibrionaceae bacterium]
MQETAMEQAVTAGEEDFNTLIDQDIAYTDKTGSIEKFFVSPKENGKQTGPSLHQRSPCRDVLAKLSL